MNAAALSLPLPSAIRKRISLDHALEFIDGIESTWRGHEAFAMWLVQTLHPKTIVDLGFDRGLSTIAFAYKNRGHVFGIDWFEEGNYAMKSFALDIAFSNISNAIRFNYAKNIHLIIGPFRDVSKKWTRKIDILHIDWAHTYQTAKHHFDNWVPFLKAEGVILFHDVMAYPEETGKFFRSLPHKKVLFPHSQGLGVATTNEILIEQIKEQFPEVHLIG